MKSYLKFLKSTRSIVNFVVNFVVNEYGSTGSEFKYGHEFKYDFILPSLCPKIIYYLIAILSDIGIVTKSF